MRGSVRTLPGLDRCLEDRELNVAVEPELSVAEGHAVAREVNHRIMHELGYLETAVVHVDPAQESGEEHHHVAAHSHDGLPTHSH